MGIRVLKLRELRSARDDFKLKKFYEKASAERKGIWFSALDDVLRGLRRLHGEDESLEVLADSMVVLLASALSHDDALGEWVRKRTDVEWRKDGDNWRLVERACAGVIVQDYLGACEDGRWPPTTHD